MSAPAIHSIITGDTARTRKTDPATSHEAADSISRESLEASEVEVLAILGEVSRPVTADEIIRAHGLRAWNGEAAGQWTDSRLRTALKQLRRAGRVVVDGRGITRTGRSAEALRLAEPASTEEGAGVKGEAKLPGNSSTDEVSS